MKTFFRPKLNLNKISKKIIKSYWRAPSIHKHWIYVWNHSSSKSGYGIVITVGKSQDLTLLSILENNFISIDGWVDKKRKGMYAT